MYNPYGQQQPNMYGQQQPQYGQQQPQYGQQQPQYGQQQPQYGGQQQMNVGINPNMGGMNMNINMGGGQFGMQQQQPVFNKVAVGQGIDQREYQTIVNCCTQVYLQKQNPLSTSAGKAIKQNLGNEWFVIVSNAQDKDYDFSITSVEGGDFMSFTLDQTLFQIVKTSR